MNKDMRKNLIILAIAVLVVGGGSFYAGYAFANHSRISAEMARPGANGNNFPGGNGTFSRGNRTVRAPGNMIMGDILKQDNQSLTVKLTDGSTRLILISDKTTVTKSVSGTIGDLTTGVSVRASGTPNSDGSLTAQSIQIVPAGQEQPSGQAVPPPQPQTPPTDGQPQIK